MESPKMSRDTPTGPTAGNNGKESRAGSGRGPVTAVLVGAGSRGRDAYGRYALRHPDRLRFVAVAELDPNRARIFKQQHDVPDEMVFSDWKDLLAPGVGKIADAAFICTPDRLHYQPTIAALELDYDIVLEKPIAPTMEECARIAHLAMERRRIVQVCHVLRFTGFWKKVKEVVDSGRIGKVIHYDHSENVSFWHFGHSYVRGPYKNKDTSTPIVLAKTCHDLDLMQWIIGEKPLDVQSTGMLTWYRPENAPEGAPDRCTDGCPVGDTCPWNAVKLYVDAEPLIQMGYQSPSGLLRALTGVALDHKGIIRFLSLFQPRLKTVLNWDEFPATALTTDLTPEGKMKALREGPFGKCIFKCGNDVPDHMISTFTFPGGATGTLTMHGLSDVEGREIRIFGTRGSIRGVFRYTNEQIDVMEFKTGRSETVYKGQLNIQEGHGGGDTGLMDAFTSLYIEGKTQEEAGTTGIAGALESHAMGFAAEDARIHRDTRKVDDYRP